MRRLVAVAVVLASVGGIATGRAAACKAAMRPVPVFDQQSDDRTPPAFAGVQELRIERFWEGHETRASCDDLEDGWYRQVIAMHAPLPEDTAYVQVSMRRPGDPSAFWTSIDTPYMLDKTVQWPPRLELGPYCVSVAAVDRAGNAAGGDVELCAFVNGPWAGSDTEQEGLGALALFAGLTLAGAAVTGLRRRRGPRARVVR